MAISIVGAIAIPFGDPQFLDRAIVLELSFLTLAIVILLDFRHAVRRVPLSKLALYACIPLAIIVLVGNSLASPHVEIMRTFLKALQCSNANNWGLCLAGALIASTIIHLESRRQDIIQKQKKN